MTDGPRSRIPSSLGQPIGTTSTYDIGTSSISTELLDAAYRVCWGGCGVLGMPNVLYPLCKRKESAL